MKDYDNIIQAHYKKVAEKYGLSPDSTMEDRYVRDKETEAILEFVGNFPHGQRILDAGCGNGCTLYEIMSRSENIDYTGIDISPEMCHLAKSRFQGTANIIYFDIAGNLPPDPILQNYDILICQRVLINILDYNDQKKALQNIIDMVRPGGKLLFIEAFELPLLRLNVARAELGLPELPVAEHNFYLLKNFFDHPQLRPYYHDGMTPPNFLSTHYYVSRVLHPLFDKGKPFTRNSEFVNFFSDALQNVGDYSPIKLYTFEKI